MSRAPALLACVLALLVAGCGGIKIAPEPRLPKALIEPIGAKVGVIIGGDMKHFAHTETRAGVDWNIALGAGHEKLARQLFGAEFAGFEVFADLDAARKATDLKAIFEPRIEQYSFATERETGGAYVAVTIRYRILLLSPQGDPVDTLTLTGYGSALPGKMSSSEPLEIATRAAMRDAAAKFLTQFPALPVAQQLAKGEALVGVKASAVPAQSALEIIAAVPVRASRRGAGF
jgi:hypothetical protein